MRANDKCKVEIDGMSPKLAHQYENTINHGLSTIWNGGGGSQLQKSCVDTYREKYVAARSHT